MTEYDKIADRARPPATDVEKRLRAAAPYLLAVLKGMQQANGCFDDCRWEYSGRHRSICLEATVQPSPRRGGRYDLHSRLRTMIPLASGVLNCQRDIRAQRAA